MGDFSWQCVVCFKNGVFRLFVGLVVAFGGLLFDWWWFVSRVFGSGVWFALHELFALLWFVDWWDLTCGVLLVFSGLPRVFACLLFGLFCVLDLTGCLILLLCVMFNLLFDLGCVGLLIWNVLRCCFMIVFVIVFDDLLVIVSFDLFIVLGICWWDFWLLLECCVDAYRCRSVFGSCVL